MTPRLRRGVLLVALLGVAACAPPPPKGNVILVSIDCLNARQFAHALSSGTMPTLAAVARESLVFTRAYAHAPWTTPAHMSMLTGLYPSQHGRDVPPPLQQRLVATYDRVPTFRSLADRLGTAGFETVAFVGQGSISGIFGLAQGFRRYRESPKRTEAQDLRSTRQAIVRWLARRPPGPFFLFLHTYDLHTPRPASYTTEDRALRGIDSGLGLILRELRERGLYDSALVIVTGDHGSAMKAGQKCCTHGAGHYEENLRVPLLVRLPNGGTPGESDRVVAHVDIVPTVLDVLGLRADDYAGPGVSVLRTLRADPAPARLSYSEADAYCARRHALVDARFKYIYTPVDTEGWLLNRLSLFHLDCPATCKTLPREEFFDLTRDPDEDHELIAGGMDEEQARALASYRSAMEQHLNLAPQYRRAIEPPRDFRLDPDVQRALKALGYVQ
ncbi:MAG TPA: sulfatase [Candidatus Binatia bacterium]|nr:sulfatase [Candidatus Binatia bacterium]